MNKNEKEVLQALVSEVVSLRSAVADLMTTNTVAPVETTDEPEHPDVDQDVLNSRRTWAEKCAAKDGKDRVIFEAFNLAGDRKIRFETVDRFAKLNKQRVIRVIEPVMA